MLYKIVKKPPEDLTSNGEYYTEKFDKYQIKKTYKIEVKITALQELTDVVGLLFCNNPRHFQYQESLAW